MAQDRLLVISADPRIQQTVVEAFSGTEVVVDAVDQAGRAEQLAACRDYDFVVLDKDVGASDSVELFKKLSRRGSGMRPGGILCSERPTLNTVDRAVHAGIQHVVSKPIDPKEVLSLVHQLTSDPARAFDQRFRNARVGFRSEDGLTRGDRPSPCEYCSRPTRWYDPVRLAYFCCEDCLVRYRDTQGP